MLVTANPRSPSRVQSLVHVSGQDRTWPLHDSTTTRALERRALAQAPAHSLMARAGLSAARLLRVLRPHAQRVAILAGPGNNGGDGLVAAVHLQRLGLDVRVLHLADPARLPPDAAHARSQARAAGLRFATRLDELTTADVVVDALLGLGSTREPAGTLGDAVQWVNAWSNATARPVLALDLPTGLHADSGARLGAACIQARWTLSLLTLKPGLFTAEGRDLAGDVWLDSLDSGDDGIADAWLGPASAPPSPGFVARRHAQHKGSFGDVLVVGGAKGMHGALWLAARAALTAGAGRVYASPLTPTGEPAWPELMLRDQAWDDTQGFPQRCTVVCGCGGGAAVADALPSMLAQAPRLVLDADALNRLAEQPELQQALVRRANAGQITVMTPHPLEAARLLQTDSATVQRDRLSAARALAHRWSVVVVLKGSGTVVAAPGQPVWINASGNARLATPGSGDVLAGWLGGLWAQRGQERSPLDAAVQTARLAVWLHGRAADRTLPATSPIRALELIDAMAACAEPR